MKVQVIKFNSLEEVLAHLAAHACVNCNCKERVPASAEEEQPAVDLNYFLQSLAEKKGWRVERLAGWLNGIAELSPIAAFNIVVREIAVYLDHKYESFHQEMRLRKSSHCSQCGLHTCGQGR